MHAFMHIFVYSHINTINIDTYIDIAIFTFIICALVIESYGAPLHTPSSIERRKEISIPSVNELIVIFLVCSVYVFYFDL